jgi:hypothetical protein
MPVALLNSQARRVVSRAAVSSLDLAPPKAWRRFVPLWLRSLIWIDSADNYDAFLSYSWEADGKVAPVIQSLIQGFLRPWYKLRAKTVFRDLSCLPAGSSLKAELFERLDRSKHLIVLASPKAAVSRGMEIEGQYWFTRPRSGQVLIIVTSGTCETWEEIRTRLLPPAVRDNLTSEPLWVPLQHRRDKIEVDPTQVRGELIEDLKQVLLRFYPGYDWGQLRGEERKQRRHLLWFLSAVGSFIFALAVMASGLAWYADVQWRESQRQLDRANQAIATGILSDLDLKHASDIIGDPKHGDPLTARQRNALWNLATADEAVRGHFVSALSASPEDMARIAACFREVSRSLGLQWPSPADAAKLFATAIAALAAHKTITKRESDTLQALAAKLTEAQALAPLLQQIGQTADAGALQALVEALQALPAKLTEAQAQQVLDAVSRQIADAGRLQALATSFGAARENAYTLRTLAVLLKALAAQLTEAQARQALDAVLRQIGKTPDEIALEALVPALPALAVRLTEVQVQQALTPLLPQIDKVPDANTFQALAGVLRALPAKLTEAQAQQVLQQIDKTTDPKDLHWVAEVLQALRANLSEAQAQQALDGVLQQIGKTTEPDSEMGVSALAKVLRALPAKLTETQAHQVLDVMLQQIGKWTTVNTLEELIQASQTKLSETQAQQVLDAVLRQIGEPTDDAVLRRMAEAVQALAAKLTEAQAQQALAPLLQQIGQTTNADTFFELVEAIQALPAKLTEAQAQQVLDGLQKAMASDDEVAVRRMAERLKAFSAKLTEAQAQQALDALLQQIGRTTDDKARQELAKALQALAAKLTAKLTEAQAQQVLDVLLQEIGKTTDRDALRALAEVLRALPPKLTEAQALAPLLQQIGQTTDAHELWARVDVLQAFPAKLADAQAQQALAPLLQQIGRLNDTPDLWALTQALQPLAAKLTEAQAQQVLDALLRRIGETTEAYALAMLVQALQPLAAKLTKAQAQQVLDGLLQQVGRTTHNVPLKALAQQLQALQAKLTEAQAQRALTVAMSSLAWAATEDEAVDWARTLVALLPSATDQGGPPNLVAALVYPTAAGPATEVLLDALRARHPDAPAGTAAILAWIAEKYPNQVRPPICPTPPQPTSDLKCPPSETDRKLPIVRLPVRAAGRKTLRNSLLMRTTWRLQIAGLFPMW